MRQSDDHAVWTALFQSCPAGSHYAWDCSRVLGLAAFHTAYRPIKQAALRLITHPSIDLTTSIFCLYGVV